MRKATLAWTFLILPFFLLGCDETKIPAGCNPAELGISDSTTSSKVENKTSTGEISLDPTELRKRLFNGNTSVLLSVNRAHEAKVQVNIARGNLLPSINLGTLVGTVANPAFMISQVDVLLPFLIPSKWFDYHSIKDLLSAELLSLRLMKLNTYASVYSLYFTKKGDEKLHSIYDEEVRDLTGIEEFINGAYQVGLATLEDLNRAKGQTGLARINLSKIEELLAGEHAAMRHALSFGTQDRFTLMPFELPASEWETRPLEEALDHAMKLSPESLQIQHLESAAKNATWSKAFGFITGVDMRTNRVDGSFSPLTGSASFNLGFALFPSVKLAQNKQKELALRRIELRLETTEVLERALKVVSEARQRLEIATDAERALNEVYEARHLQLQLGLTNLVTVLQARSQLRQASVEKLRASVALDLSRIPLHRAMITDQFQEIESCHL